MATFLTGIDHLLTACLDGKEHKWKRTGEQVIVTWQESDEIMMAIKFWEDKSLMAIFATFSHDIPKDLFPLFVHIVNSVNARLSSLKVSFDDRTKKYYEEFGETDIWVITYMNIVDYHEISLLCELGEVSSTCFSLKQDLDKWMSISGLDFSLPEKSKINNCS